jgi:predicted ATPase
MLSLPNDGRYSVLELTPEQRRQRTLEALILQVQALARSKPVLMIVEDAHWTDPSSLEVFSRVVDRISALRVLLMVTFRPEFEPPWVGRPHVTVLTLNRLTRREIDAMIDGVVGNKPIPMGVRQDIVERTDGIPLFVEEMTKAVLEAEGDGEAQWTAAAVPSPAVAVPATLHASLMARLDRLGSAKEVAQIGAAIGREFSHGLLAAVVRKSEEELASALDRLIETGLLFRQGVPPVASYLFKHALVQDAAYSTLLREPRRALHARIAAVLEGQFAEIAENQPELLARHCTEAGLIERAVYWWGKSGQRSLERSALVEAIEQFTRALSQIATLPATAALRREQIKLQVAQITPLMHVKGYAAPETKAAGERARLLIEQAEACGEPPEDPLLLFEVLYAICGANLVAFNGALARAGAEQFLALAEKQAATIPLMLGHRIMATVLFYLGQFAESRKHYDRAIALYDPREHRPVAIRFGQHVGVSTLAYRTWTLWVLGYPAMAIADTERALSDARYLGQASTLMFALTCATIPAILCGNYAAAHLEAEELAALADEQGSLFRKTQALLHKGCTLALAGNAADAIQLITSAIGPYRSTGATFTVAFYLSHLATAYAQTGQFDEAWRCLGEARDTVEATNERWLEAEVNRNAGEIALKSPDPDTAKAGAYFNHALAIARKQQAKSWELRAAMSMARLWRDQGKRDEAHELLAPVYGWFTEGFDTRDLKEAKALLDELAA